MTFASPRSFRSRGTAAGVVGFLQGVEWAGGENVGGLGRRREIGGVPLARRLETRPVHPQVVLGRQALDHSTGMPYVECRSNASRPGTVVRPRLSSCGRYRSSSFMPFSRLRRNRSSSSLITSGCAARSPQFGIWPAHRLGHDRDELVQERLARPSGRRRAPRGAAGGG